MPASAWRGHSRAGKRLRTGRSRPTCPPCGVSPPQQGHGRARGRRFARRGRCACFPGLNLCEYSQRPAGAVGLRDVAGEPLVGHTRGQIRARRRRQPHHRRRVDHRKGRVEASFGHRMRVSDTLQGAAGISAGGTATPDIEVTKDRPGPTVPQDLTTALAAAPKKIQNLRSAVTPTSRQGPSEEPTTGRGEHLHDDERKEKVLLSHPCACTDPDQSKNGKLLEAAEVPPLGASARSSFDSRGARPTTVAGGRSRLGQRR